MTPRPYAASTRLLFSDTPQFLFSVILSEAPQARSRRTFRPAAAFCVCRPLSAFTLIELLTTIAVTAILAGTAWPVYQHIVQTARAAACMSNLRQIGSALNLYLGEHNMVMPALKAGRASTADDVPVIDNILNAYAPSARVFACPADTSGQAAKTGTSYFWNVALSGQPMSTLNFFNHTGAALIPVLSDKSAFHPYLPSKVNLLYADGHTDKEISFASPSPTP